jgi:hypothetical protein
MIRKRYEELGTGSFFGEYLYDIAVPESHFLRKLEALVDWDLFPERLVRLYQGQFHESGGGHALCPGRSAPTRCCWPKLESTASFSVLEIGL